VPADHRSNTEHFGKSFKQNEKSFNKVKKRLPNHTDGSRSGWGVGKTRFSLERVTFEIPLPALFSLDR
jgi:hypothetical protein